MATILMGHKESLRGVRFSVSHGSMGRCKRACVTHLEWLGYVWWCGLVIDYLREDHLSLEMCKSNAFVDRDVSKQKHSILKIKATMVSPIKLGAIS